MKLKRKRETNKIKIDLEDMDKIITTKEITMLIETIRVIIEKIEKIGNLRNS